MNLMTPLDRDQRLELGKQAHERPADQTIEAMAMAVGLHKSTLYQVMKEYRAAHDISTPNAERTVKARGRPRSTGTLTEKQARKKAANDRYRARKAEASAATGNQLVPMPKAVDVEPFKIRIRELEEEVEQLEHERATLQKILMAVGAQL